ncbi:ComF family protein [uncultured Microbulbifer sp.]|uniref:ComF family protein n=1 Tax=uncultured Microbulbifer sp. TaxID=348147 RepID=UPI0025CF7BB4|nr:ComF family protein [uncultured Microbulbifer sp.]
MFTQRISAAVRRLPLKPGLSLSRCLLCHAGDTGGSGICRPCRTELPALQHACSLCALPLANAGDHLCPRCLQQPPPLAGGHACWFYAYPVAQLIQRFKYQGDLAAGRSLAEVAATELEPVGDRPDVLVPIPLHWRRQLSRGYNQAYLIAEIFARHWRIPLDTRLLRKTARTGSQSQLKRRQRLKNLSSSFRAGPRVSGLHIGLVDDVITTGATLEAAAETLLQAGAAEVSAYALARTP